MSPSRGPGHLERYETQSVAPLADARLINKKGAGAEA